MILGFEKQLKEFNLTFENKALSSWLELIRNR